MLIAAAMVWILPLFAGEPKLGPVNNRITHFVPMPFPLLLVVPAFAIDLIRHAIGHGRSWWRDWLIVIACAAAFVVVFAITQWKFSEFMLTDRADNWFFGADRHWGYQERVGPWQKEFWAGRRSNPTADAATFVKAFLCALLSCRLGLWLGNWMAKVRR
jgi:hypothetical protein